MIESWYLFPLGVVIAACAVFSAAAAPAVETPRFEPTLLLAGSVLFLALLASAPVLAQASHETLQQDALLAASDAAMRAWTMGGSRSSRKATVGSTTAAP